MLLLRQRPEFTEALYEWLLRHGDAVRNGTALYKGTKVDEGTVFRQYEFCFSFIFFTANVATEHRLPTRKNRLTPWTYSLVSLLFGWWSFPWGPLYTLFSLLTNMCGGNRRTATSLLAQLEWGYRIPGRIDARDHRKDLLNLDETAVAEIKRRRWTERQDPALGILIVPTKWDDAECEVRFVVPVSNGSEWVGQSQGVTILVKKKDAQRVEGRRLSFEDGVFVVRPQTW